MPSLSPCCPVLPPLLLLLLVHVLVGVVFLPTKFSQADVMSGAEVTATSGRDDLGSASHCLSSSLFPDSGDSAASATSYDVIAALAGRQQRIVCSRYHSPYHNSSLGVWLSVLLPLYSSRSDLPEPSACTRPRPKLIVQLVEATRLLLQQALETEFAKPSTFLRHFKGVEVRDTCGVASAAQEAAMSVATLSKRAADVCPRPPWSKRAPTTGTCSSTMAGERQQIGAIVGPALSSELEVASPVLSVFGIPHITYWATSNLFANKDEYPHLFRTAAMDRHAAEAIIDLLEDYSWHYISLLHGTDSPGLPSIADSVRTSDKLRQNRICIAIDDQFRRSDRAKMGQIAHRLINNPMSSSFHKPSVVVFIAGYIYVQRMFEVIAELAESNKTFAESLAQSHFVWIGSDGWLTRATDIFPLPARCQSQGTAQSLGLHSILGPVFRVPNAFTPGAHGFRDRLDAHLQNTQVNRSSILANPWLAAVWRERFPYCLNVSTRNETCNRTIGEVYGTHALPTLSGSFWLAFQTSMQLLKEVLSDVPLADASSLSLFTGKQLRARMLNASLPCENGTCPVFHNNQETTPAFSIYAVVLDGCERSLQEIGQWQRSSNSSRASGEINWDARQRIVASNSSLWASALADPPQSICARACAPGHVQVTGDAFVIVAVTLQLNIQTCRRCWLCEKCPAGKYSANNSCQQCPTTRVPNEQQSACVRAPETYLSYKHAAAKVLMVLAGSSFLVTTLAIAGIAVYRKTESVQQAGAMQSIVLLLTTLVGFSIMFVYFAVKPGVPVCLTVYVLTASPMLFCNILIVSRLFRLIALSETHRDAPPVLQRLSKVVGQTGRRQAAFVAAAAAVCALVFGICLSFQSVVIGEHMQASTLFLTCEPPLVSEITLGVLMALLILMTLPIVIRVRRMRLYIGDDAPSGGAQEGQLLHRVCLSLFVIHLCFVLTRALTPVDLASMVVGLALWLHHDAILYFLVLPRVVAMVLNSSARKSSISRSNGLPASTNQRPGGCPSKHGAVNGTYLSRQASATGLLPRDMPAPLDLARPVMYDTNITPPPISLDGQSRFSITPVSLAPLPEVFEMTHCNGKVATDNATSPSSQVGEIAASRKTQILLSSADTQVVHLGSSVIYFEYSV